MIKKNIVLLILVCILFSCRLSGTIPDRSASSLKVTDFRGKEVVLDKPAKRIVCLIESALSGLYMLQADSLLVGVPSAVYKESTAPYYAILDKRIAYKQLQSPGNWDFINIESLVALQPDLVIIWSSQQEAIQAIEDKGITVYGVFLQSFSDVYKEIEDFGILTGSSARADSLISFTKNEIAGLQKIVQSTIDKRKSVYFMWSQGLLETAGTTSTVNEMIEVAGAKNCVNIPEEHVVVNFENLLEWNPDVVYISFNSKVKPPDLLAMPEWGNMNAIKNKKVFQSGELFFSDLWTLKFPIAVKMLAHSCYPDIFANSNLEIENQKILVGLYGERGRKLKQ